MKKNNHNNFDYHEEFNDVLAKIGTAKAALWNPNLDMDDAKKIGDLLCGVERQLEKLYSADHEDVAISQVG